MPDLIGITMTKDRHLFVKHAVYSLNIIKLCCLSFYIFSVQSAGIWMIICNNSLLLFGYYLGAMPFVVKTTIVKMRIIL